MARIHNGGFKMKPGEKINTSRGPRVVQPRPLSVRYATPPPSPNLTWLETAHFAPTDHETVLLAWPRTEGFTFRTGRYVGTTWLLSDDTPPREKPSFFADLS